MMFPEAASARSEDDRWEKLFRRRMEVETVNAVKLMRERGIEPIVIKGWAAARNYPADKPRKFADVDLAVSPDDYEKAVAARNGPDGARLRIDLHRSLRHLDTRDWNGIFSDSEQHELDGYPVRIPSAEDHLRLLAVHWLNDGGEQQEKLWDIHYAVEKRPEDFDWDKCLGAVSARRRDWIVATIGLAHRLLGLEVDDLPFADEAKNPPDWLVKAVRKEWRNGVRTRSLMTFGGSPRGILTQLGKRFPPNPIQSTIENEGDIVNGPRWKYQLLSIGNRSVLTMRRIATYLKIRKI